FWRLLRCRTLSRVFPVMTYFKGAEKMGKRGASVSMAEEIRILLKENQALSGREVIEALRKKFPKADINENSCQVAYSNARRKMGLVRTVKRRPGKKKSVGKVGRPAATTVSSSPVSVDITMLKAAKAYLEQCKGDAALAAETLRQIAALQMK
ncbi:MAG: hypothetical protein KDA85_16140, partial [Planctomycetaceae bacterium]|nr:hypothetical protein [Planctomycetaceae bacterium]